MAGNRPGPRDKGDRLAMHVRVPREHRKIYAAAALAADMPLGDYVALMLAQAHDLNAPEYVYRRLHDAGQRELPLPA